MKVGFVHFKFNSFLQLLKCVDNNNGLFCDYSLQLTTLGEDMFFFVCFFTETYSRNRNYECECQLCPSAGNCVIHHTSLLQSVPDLLKLTDLIIKVIHTPLVLQAELRKQICTQLSLQ